MKYFETHFEVLKDMTLGQAYTVYNAIRSYDNELSTERKRIKDEEE